MSSSVNKRGLARLAPKLRFPESREAGEWEEKRLSNVIDLISGMHLSPDAYSTIGEVPYFTGPSDFTNEVRNVASFIVRFTLFKKSLAFINRSIFTDYFTCGP
ncbi:hypothetical protein CCP4SC76_4470001 [Gammaproteobacteria bacterium]